MKEIRTKSIIKAIKALDKTANVSRKIKNTYIRTKEQTEQLTYNENCNYVDAAGNKVGESMEAIAQNTGHAVQGYARKVKEKIRRHQQGDTTTSYTDTSSNSWVKHGNKKSNHTERQAASDVKEQPHQSIFSINAEQTFDRGAVPTCKQETLKQKAVSPKAKEAVRRKFILSKQNKSVKLRFIQNRAKNQLNQSKVPWMASKSTVSPQSQRPSGLIFDQSTQQAFFQPAEGMKVQDLHTTRPADYTVKQSENFCGKTLKNIAKKTIKTAQKSAKTIQYGIKTSQVTVKTATKTAQTSKIAAQVTQMATRAAAVSVKTVVKAFISTAKAMFAAAKSLTVIIAAGGWIALVVILVICIAGFFSSSTFGVFLSNESVADSAFLMKDVVSGINTEFAAKIQQIQQGNPYDVLDILGSESNSASRWCEILAIYAVKVAADPEHGMEVATLDDTKVGILRNTFWDMNKIDYSLETIVYKESRNTTDEDGNKTIETAITTKVVLHINVSSKSYIEMAGQYGFNEEQEDMLKELMKDEYRHLFIDVIGS